MKQLLLLMVAGFGLCCSRQPVEASKEAAPAKPAEGEKGLVLNAEAQRRAGVQVVEVQPRRLPEGISVSGRITVNEERTVHIGSIAEGRVVQVLANVGDTVRQGQVLARLHTHDVHEVRASYQKAEAEVRRQTAAVDFAKRQRDRYLRLFELKSASRQEVEKAEADVRGAETDLANARSDLEKEAVHLTEFLQVPIADIDHDSQKHNDTADFVPLKASQGGTVTARPVTAGSVLKVGDVAFTISDLNSVWMLASVPESQVSHVRIGMPVRLTVQAYPETPFMGRIVRLGTELDAATRTLQVRVLVPNPGQRLRPEMFGTADLGEGSSREAIFVPEEALQDLNGGSIVFVRKTEQQFEPRPVQVSRRVNGEAEITAGLRSGERVAVKGVFLLKSQLLKGTLGEE